MRAGLGALLVVRARLLLAPLLLTQLLLTLAAPLQAHELRPAYLGIQQTGEQRFELLWRVPEPDGPPLAIDVRLPENCETAGEILRWQESEMRVERWAAVCAGGLFGQRIEVGGLSAAAVEALARFERLDGTTQVERLSPDKTGFVASQTESGWQVALTYGVLGVEHILLGIDHLLFVLALVLLVSGTRTLLWTITAFTLAHSLTLAAATLGWVAVPQQPVEAVIALSILLVTLEIVHWRQGKPGITRRRPWLVAFTFGLLHGFGFAGALTEIGLPEQAIPLALLFFNLGVELGQVVFILAVLLSWSILKKAHWPHWAWRLPVYAIGSMAAFWTIDRIAGF